MTTVLDALRQDVRQAARGLRRTPGFTLTVVATLALAIGTNTAIFSVVDQLLLRPLPYPDGDRVVRIYESEFGNGDDRSDVNPANWLDWQRQSQTLQSIAAWDPSAATLTGIGEPERLQSLSVSAEFFPVLGVQPFLGRVVSPEDDRPNAPRVAVISYALWQQRFNSDPQVIGRIILLNEAPVEIIGVMPQGFRFVFADTDFWTAFRLDRNRSWRTTAGRFMSVVARVRSTATVDQARMELDGIARTLAQTYTFNRDMSVTVVPMRQEFVGDLQAPLLVLYGAVVVLLAIACLNVANLLLVRSLSRRREMAIRTSLGARRVAIIRQLLVESAMLALMGGMLGLLVARWGLKALLALIPTELVPFGELRVDHVVLMYIAGLSLLTGIVVGLVPAVTAFGRTIGASLRSSGQNTAAHSPRMQQLFIVGQVAMTVVLLCGAGLLIRTVAALNATNAGFDRHNLLTMELALPATRYNQPARVAEFFRQVTVSLRALPGADEAAAAATLPVTGIPVGGTGFHILGRPEDPPSQRSSTRVRIITPQYFRTLGVPILQGREFTDADTELMFVVNQAFATRYLRERDPLSTAISVGMQEKNPHAPIIGVVRDVSEGLLWGTADPTVFYSYRQMPRNAMVLLLRGANASALTSGAIDAIHRLDPNLALANVRSFDSVLGESIARERLLAVISTVFAASGLVLAALGLYGLLAFVVAGCTREIGIRMALGAQLGALVRGVLGNGVRLVASGGAVGALMALATSRSIAFLFHGVSPYDPWTYGTVFVLLGSVTVAATLIPARRVVHVDPVAAIRAD